MGLALTLSVAAAIKNQPWGKSFITRLIIILAPPDRRLSLIFIHRLSAGHLRPTIGSKHDPWPGPITEQSPRESPVGDPRGPDGSSPAQKEPTNKGGIQGIPACGKNPCSQSGFGQNPRTENQTASKRTIGTILQ